MSYLRILNTTLFCVLSLFVLLSTASAEEQGSTQHLQRFGLDVGILHAPMVMEALKQAPTPPNQLTLDTEGRLKLFAQIAQDSVMEFLRVRQFCYETTAEVPLFMGEESLLVSNEYISYNLFDLSTSEEVLFGPYIQNWKSVRRQYTGHYGVRLLLPW